MATLNSSASANNAKACSTGATTKLSNMYVSSATSQSISNAPNSSSNGTWSTYTSPSIGINTIGTTIGGNTNYSGYLYPDVFNTSNWTDVSMRALLSCLPEEKIEEMMDIVKENAPDNDIFKMIITSVVSCRHFSEDFLLKYVDHLTKDTLYTKHRENICSREYHSLALLLEERDKD